MFMSIENEMSRAAVLSATMEAARTRCDTAAVLLEVSSYENGSTSRDRGTNAGVSFKRGECFTIKAEADYQQGICCRH